MKNFLRHLFLPHHSNNQRARLLHHTSILAISFLLLIATAALNLVQKNYPQVLGTAANISTQDLLVLTNQVRAQNNLPPLNYNDALATAAYWKGVDMFSNDYWAHIDPKTGATPWIFIQKAGYQYTYAGENLARGFGDAGSIVNAWMASPSHKANMLSPNYQDVGFSVQEGTLTGEANTILVVQMFGGKSIPPLSKAAPAAAKEPVVVGKVEAAGTNQNQQQQKQSFTQSPVVDKFSFAKNITQFLLLLFIIIFILDILLIEKKKISRIVGHNLDHILYLLAILAFVIFLSSGSIF